MTLTSRAIRGRRARRRASGFVAARHALRGHDRDSALFDRLFGDEITALSALTTNVSWQLVDPGYAQITKHDTVRKTP